MEDGERYGPLGDRGTLRFERDNEPTCQPLVFHHLVSEKLGGGREGEGREE